MAGIINLSHAPGLEVTAEGVETTEQAQQLQAMGWGLAQGYVFSEPLPAEKVSTLLSMGSFRRQPDPPLPSPRQNSLATQPRPYSTARDARNHRSEAALEHPVKYGYTVY